MSQSKLQSPPPPADSRMQALSASAHLMTLETGTFCVVNGSSRPAAGVIFGVRVSAIDPADPNVAIAALRPDGWLAGDGDSALIRVQAGPARVLVTIYRPTGVTDGAPSLRVLRLSEAAPAAEAPPPATAARRPAMVLTEPHDVIAHVQSAGDVGRAFGEWVGTPGSQVAIEGFSLRAPKELESSDLTYQAVLGRDWMSPWSDSGQFCGSRGMALPILGLKIKLGEAALHRYDLSLSATFVDGTKLDDVGGDESCETPAFAALEAFCVTLKPKSLATAAKSDAKPAPSAKAGNPATKALTRTSRGPRSSAR